MESRSRRRSNRLGRILTQDSNLLSFLFEQLTKESVELGAQPALASTSNFQSSFLEA